MDATTQKPCRRVERTCIVYRSCSIGWMLPVENILAVLREVNDTFSHSPPLPASVSSVFQDLWPGWTGKVGGYEETALFSRRSILCILVMRDLEHSGCCASSATKNLLLRLTGEREKSSARLRECEDSSNEKPRLSRDCRIHPRNNVCFWCSIRISMSCKIS